MSAILEVLVEKKDCNLFKEETFFAKEKFITNKSLGC